MSYSPPSVGPAGLTIPSYDDILQQLLASFRNIYGQDVYLGNDSADFQFISVIALALRDTAQAIQLDYNNRAPNFAIGAALDTIIKVNGLTRKVATFSTVQVLITGTPGTIINNGIVQDTVFNHRWDLPTPVIIPGGGSITVSAICEVVGAVTVPPSSVTVKVTPTAGWLSVTNVASSVPGQPVEPDSSLRSRQAISTELPSITLLAGTVAGIAATLGVTRFNVVENPTSAVDALGNPPHSITCVVEGGTDLDVATAIFNNRGIGCFTNGTTTVPIADSLTGIILNISFDRPTYVDIYVTLNVHPLQGYTTTITDQIKQAITDYLNGLQIGEDLTISGLYGAAMQVTPNILVPLFSVKAVKADTTPTPTVSNDIPIAFNAVTRGTLVNVIITLV